MKLTELAALATQIYQEEKAHTGEVAVTTLARHGHYYPRTEEQHKQFERYDNGDLAEFAIDEALFRKHFRTRRGVRIHFGHYKWNGKIDVLIYNADVQKDQLVMKLGSCVVVESKYRTDIKELQDHNGEFRAQAGYYCLSMHTNAAIIAEANGGISLRTILFSRNDFSALINSGADTEKRYRAEQMVRA